MANQNVMCVKVCQVKATKIPLLSNVAYKQTFESI